MGTIAIQTKVGELGEKATTELSYDFDSMVNCGEFQYGLNENGIYRLNSGSLDDSTVFTSSITFQTSEISTPSM